MSLKAAASENSFQNFTQFLIFETKAKVIAQRCSEKKQLLWKFWNVLRKTLVGESFYTLITIYSFFDKVHLYSKNAEKLSTFTLREM